MATVARIPTSMLRRPMNINRDVLTLMQWLSPSFPVGAFAYSHGLETVIQSGAITKADALQDWLIDVLEHGGGRNDCILLRAAYGCETVEGVKEVDHTAIAVSASAERVLETTLQGGAFAQTTAAILGSDEITASYPVAVGYAAARQGLDVNLTAALYLQALASNLVSAAVRAVPLGQTEGQKVLAALLPLCHQIAQDTQSTLEDLSSTAFLSDIAAMQHETLQPRIFRS